MILYTTRTARRAMRSESYGPVTFHAYQDCIKLAGAPVEPVELELGGTIQPARGPVQRDVLRDGVSVGHLCPVCTGRHAREG